MRERAVSSGVQSSNKKIVNLPHMYFYIVPKNRSTEWSVILCVGCMSWLFIETYPAWTFMEKKRSRFYLVNGKCNERGNVKLFFF